MWNLNYISSQINATHTGILKKNEQNSSAHILPLFKQDVTVIMGSIHKVNRKNIHIKTNNHENKLKIEKIINVSSIYSQDVKQSEENG